MGYGISASSDDSFIIRNSGGDGDYIGEYIIRSNTYTDLFALKKAKIKQNDVAVLPDGNIVLNWNEIVKVYSRKGKMIKKTGMYFNGIAGMEYSTYYGMLVVLDHSSLYFVNPVNMKIEKTLFINKIPGQKTDITVAEDGTIYIATIKNSVYKIIFN